MSDHVSCGSGCSPAGPSSLLVPERPLEPLPAPKRRRLRGKQADVAGAFLPEGEVPGSLAPGPLKRRRLEEAGAAAILIEKAEALRDDCSVSAVWEAAVLRSAAGEAAYEAFIASTGLVSEDAMASQLTPHRFGLDHVLHVDCHVAADREAAVLRTAAGDAAVEAPFCSTGIASGTATAFELPPDLDGQMCDISQLDAFNAIVDEEEDVFGHGDDLGEAAYE